MHGKRTKDDLDLSRVDFVIEMKSEADPFVLKVPSNPRDHTSNSGDDLNSFLHLTSGSRSNLGQITAYDTAIIGSQYRTHTVTGSQPNRRKYAFCQHLFPEEGHNGGRCTCWDI